MTVQNASSSGFHRPAAICRATSGAYSEYRGSVSHSRIDRAASGEMFLAAKAASSLASAASRSNADAIAMLEVGKYESGWLTPIVPQPAAAEKGQNPNER